MPAPLITPVGGVSVDTIGGVDGSGGIQASGEVAQILLANNMDPRVLRTQAILRKEEWMAFDNELIDVARDEFSFVSSLISAGMVYRVDNGLGTMELQWQRMGDQGSAMVSMDGTLVNARRDRQEFDLQSTILPIIHSEFAINTRMLEASRRSGRPLDTAGARAAMQAVMEKIEDIVFEGTLVSQATRKINGLKDTEINVLGDDASTKTDGAVPIEWEGTNVPHVQWSDPGVEPQDMINQILNWVDALQNARGAEHPEGAYTIDVGAQSITVDWPTGQNSNNAFGPYTMWVSPRAHLNMSRDYYVRGIAGGDGVTQQAGSISTRLLQIPGLATIRPTRRLQGNQVIFMEMNKRWMDEIIGLEPVTVEWTTNGGFTFNFKVLAIMVPRFRNTMERQSGILYAPNG